MHDTTLQQRIQQRLGGARRNPAVFIHRFTYTYDPKTPPHHLELRLFPFQKQLVTQVQQAIDQGFDLFIEKCREMGATYTVLDVSL